MMNNSGMYVDLNIYWLRCLSINMISSLSYSNMSKYVS